MPLIVNFLLETDLCLPYLSFIQKTAAEGYDSGILFMIFRIDNNGGVICFFFLSYLSNIAVRYIPFGRPNNKMCIRDSVNDAVHILSRLSHRQSPDGIAV